MPRLYSHPIAVLTLVIGATHSAAVVPFSWDLDREPLPAVLDIPEGMTWVVEYASGVMESHQFQFALYPPAVRLAQPESVSGEEEQVFYLPPSLVYHNEEHRESLWSYNQPMIARYRGEVEATTATLIGDPFPGAFSPRVSVIGYLTPTLGADFNGDSVVNAADYTIMRDQPQYWDVGDRAQWVVAYGSGATESPVTVPEPTALTLAALLVVAASPLRHR